jgi:hypothetical protein
MRDRKVAWLALVALAVVVAVDLFTFARVIARRYFGV